MSDQECQDNELCALESIYNKEEIKIIKEDGKSGGQFQAYVELSPNFRVIYRDLRGEHDDVFEELSVKYLPPLVLYFSLPADYPSTTPPSFTLSCKWLRKLHIAKLCRKLDEIWEENKGMEILFLWTQFLKEDSLSYLNFEEKLDVSSMYTYHLKYSSRCRSRSFQRPKLVVKENAGEALPQLPVNESNHKNHFSVPTDPFNMEASNSSPQGQSSQKENSHQWPNKRKMPGSVDPRVVLDLNPLTSIIKVLTEYDKCRQIVIFQRSFFSCTICFQFQPGRNTCRQLALPSLSRGLDGKKQLQTLVDTTMAVETLSIQDIYLAEARELYIQTILGLQDRAGSQCTKFEPCGHVFCRECISSYFEVRIQSGTVKSIMCPEDKCKSEASPSQVQELVSPELFSKYDSVLLNQMFDTMKDIVYCPRSFCQYPTTHEPTEKMATCPSCQYVFCIYCKMVYHGVEPCQFKSDEKNKLVEEYQSSNSKHRAELEQRYGKKQLQTLVDTTMSEKWIQSNSKNCPHCNAAIEKSDGCNKMICWRCNTYFCWICSARLNPLCPYLHFNSTTSKCYNMLFLGVEDMDVEVGEFLDGDE